MADSGPQLRLWTEGAWTCEYWVQQPDRGELRLHFNGNLVKSQRVEGGKPALALAGQWHAIVLRDNQWPASGAILEESECAASIRQFVSRSGLAPENIIVARHRRSVAVEFRINDVVETIEGWGETPTEMAADVIRQFRERLRHPEDDA